jgi:hypothetical protein
MKLLQKLWERIKAQIVGEVPETDALCEFDCPKLQCTEGEWESCDRRLRRAEGELMPAKNSSQALDLQTSRVTDPPESTRNH